MLNRRYLSLFGAVCSLLAQPAAPQFEVASIKPNPSIALRHVLMPPTGGKLSTRSASLHLLIQQAYGVQGYLISGGPDWVNSAGYDLEAKAEGNPSRSQVWLMLQGLLEDRFKLKVHRELKELPVYTLTAAKGGLKLAKPFDGDCTSSGPCGDVVLGAEPFGMFARGKQVTMAELARALSGILARPVIDKTGFTDKFDANLEFAYDEYTSGMPKPRRPDDSGQPVDPARPTIAIALQHDLGLRLESAKGPVEVLVIDHAERPSEN